MTPELEKSLRESAPSVWGDVPFQFGNGWFTIAYDLGQELLILGESVTVAKEKYAQLTVYLKSYPLEGSPARTALKRAEERSSQTCETCGEPGEWDDSSAWEVIICQPCKRRKNSSGVEECVSVETPHPSGLSLTNMECQLLVGVMIGLRLQGNHKVFGNMYDPLLEKLKSGM